MGLPEILRFSTVSSKYFKNVSGELCCLYITQKDNICCVSEMYFYP